MNAKTKNADKRMTSNGLKLYQALVYPCCRQSLADITIMLINVNVDWCSQVPGAFRRRPCMSVSEYQSQHGLVIALGKTRTLVQLI
jgi:hypothetical protein